MAKTSMSREEKREEARRKIIEAAMTLFYEKGYDETTTRDIVVKTGILNGSLYNRFASKEDILLAIIAGYLDETSEALQGSWGKLHPSMAFVVPGALLLYVSSHSPRVAELIYRASCSTAAVDMYVDFYRRLSENYLGDSLRDFFDSEFNRMKVSSVIGMVGNMCGRYASGYTVPFRDALGYVIHMVSVMLAAPVFDAASLVKEVADAIDSADVMVCGHPLKGLPDYR